MDKVKTLLIQFHLNQSKDYLKYKSLKKILKHTIVNLNQFSFGKNLLQRPLKFVKVIN